MSGIGLANFRSLLESRQFVFRRLFAIYVGAVIVGTLFIVWYMGRPICYPTGCRWVAFFWGAFGQIGAASLATWWLGRIYQRRSGRQTYQITRMFESQLEALERDRLRLETVLLQMVDGVMLTDDRGRVRLINPAALELLKVGESDAYGRSFAEVAYHHQLIDLWQKCRDERVEQTAAIEITRHKIFLQAIISPTQAANDSSCIIILQDLTRIRRLESIRRDFISNVSHELLTPIASLRALVETLQDGALQDPPAADRFLSRAQDEVDVISQIVRELLTLSRIESGNVALALVPTDISDLFLTPIERLRAPSERKSIALVLDLPGGLPQVLADSDQIWQVVTNIVHNAIKYTPEGGTITFSARKKDGEVILSVRDTGIGIPKDDLPRIFERFYKADRSRQRSKAHGTGLGLAIAKHIVQAHDGQIWAKSKENKGSTFFFSLPIASSSST